MKKWLWLGAMVLLQTFDVLVTFRGGLSNEGNPLVVQFGFTPFITAKILSIGLFIVAYKICTWKDLPSPRRIFNLGTGYVLGMLTLLGIWNVYAISTF